MPCITLTDGSQKNFAEPVTVSVIAASIGDSLAKNTLAAEVDGSLLDADTLISEDASLRIITSKDAEGLDIIRHSVAHLLAHAVKILFPTAKIATGPVIKDGFYYDFSFERSFTLEDLARIEVQMKALAKANFPIRRRELNRDEAIQLFQSMGEQYKVQIIKNIPELDLLTAYQQDSFIDLCRGPHVSSTGLLKAFKLTKLGGAYWRGNSDNEMLQRIYGTAWSNQKELETHLDLLAQSEKRDHRVIGKKMDLFHFQPEAPGSVFWHPDGWTVVQCIQSHIQKAIRDSGYEEVNTPQLVDLSLWEKSGHRAKFDDDIFTLNSENREYAVKPMSCPCHVQIFKQGLKSYRDLPIRYFEFGRCHRNEPSGTLHGLMRVRSFVQDDGHTFCRDDQIQKEVLDFIDQTHQLYQHFGFTDIIHKLSTRPEKRLGSDEMWDKAEQALANALKTHGIDWQFLPGGGAFYGPKIEFSLRDCLGRIWQCGTMQVDFSTAQRLGAYYVTENGSKKAPVILHRAMLGSVERFMGVLLEHYADKLPLWLSPVQVVVINITNRQVETATKIVQNLLSLGFRVKSDLRNEKIGLKIREHTLARVPYLIILGNREVADNTIAVRALQSSRTTTMTFDKFVRCLNIEVATRVASLN